jgi:Glycosyltransferase family 28 C-terminal domain
VIGYYVHHQGRGHLSRLEAIAVHLRTPVVGLSSLPKPAGWQGDWVQLARDDDPSPASSDDVTALGVLHWAPRHHLGLSTRMATLASWVAREHPAAVVVDVSVEVALLVRLCGTPVVVVALPGERTDRTHLAAYDLADALLAPWPAEAHARGWPASWTSKTWCVGGLSRFDSRRRPPVQPRNGSPRVLLLWGAGGRDADVSSVDAARAATPGWIWTERSPGRPSPDLWAELCAADVVVTHAGQNAVADVAAARAPAVVVAQHRPFGEQAATARALSRLGIADGHTSWPSAHRWNEVLEVARRRGGAGWARWSSGRGAHDAAAHLDLLAAGRPSLVDAGVHP